MEVKVLTEGMLKNGKISINGENFYLATALPKDNELKNNYIGTNIKTIELDYDMDEDEVKKYNPGDILPVFIFFDKIIITFNKHSIFISI